MKKIIKKGINAVIALYASQLPLLFADTNVMLAVFILGLITIFIIVYCLMEAINH